jgi:hypothetical protein
MKINQTNKACKTAYEDATMRFMPDLFDRDLKHAKQVMAYAAGFPCKASASRMIWLHFAAYVIEPALVVRANILAKVQQPSPQISLASGPSSSPVP